MQHTGEKASTACRPVRGSAACVTLKGGFVQAVFASGKSRVQQPVKHSRVNQQATLTAIRKSGSKG